MPLRMPIHCFLPPLALGYTWWFVGKTHMHFYDPRHKVNFSILIPSHLDLQMHHISYTRHEGMFLQMLCNHSDQIHTISYRVKKIVPWCTWFFPIHLWGPFEKSMIYPPIPHSSFLLCTYPKSDVGKTAKISTKTLTQLDCMANHPATANMPVFSWENCNLVSSIWWSSCHQFSKCDFQSSGLLVLSSWYQNKCDPFWSLPTSLQRIVFLMS